MTGQFDEFKNTFFDECDEHLETLAEELRNLSAKAYEDEQINAIFRAVHSIKGGAAAFGLDDLVIFSHDFETALDQIRQKKVPLTEDAIRLFARATDALVDIKTHAQQGSGKALGQCADIHDAIKHFSSAGSDADSETDVTATPKDLRHTTDREPEGDSKTHFVLSVSQDFYQLLYDPIRIFNDLRADLNASIQANIDEIPDWKNYSPTTPVAAWKITTDTAQGQQAVEYFEVCEDFVDITRTRGGSPKDIASATTQSTHQATPETKSKGTIRVSVEKVDRLMNLVGELVINNSVLTELVHETDEGLSHELVNGLEEFQQLTRNIQESVMRIRAQPLKSLFLRLSKVARETSAELGKEIEFEFKGESTELDSNTIARLLDPLTHLVRNAIDHGIEHSKDRLSNGKPEVGHIKIAAHQASGSAHILVQDDGSGLDAEKIKKKAIEKGVASASHDLTTDQIHKLIFAPGFSTNENITDVSGRGVGLNIVEQEVTKLGGKVDVNSSNTGTLFSISIPLTLAVLDGMIVRTNNHTIVLPLQSVSETLIVEKGTIRQIDPHTDAIQVRNDTLPIVWMDSLLSKSTVHSTIDGKIAIIVGKEKDSKTALIVDEIVDQRQIVVKSLARGLSGFTSVKSATILGDGNIALIFEPAEISRHVAELARPSMPHNLDETTLDLEHA